MTRLQTVLATMQLPQPLDRMALPLALLLLAGVVAFVVPFVVGRRREAATDAGGADRLRREPGAVWAVDRVLRVLVDACVRDGIRFPGAVTVTLGVATVDAALARPTVAPPEPFRTPPDGRVWTAPMDAVQRYALDDVVGDEFATAVALGTGPAGLVVVDLRRTHGVIAIDGDPSARRSVARRVVDQLVTSPWTASTVLLTVGVRVEEVGGGRSVNLAHAVAAVKENVTPGVLLLSRMPTGDDRSAILAALEQPGNRWAVIVLHATDDAGWALTAHRDGRLTSEVLGDLRWSDVLLGTPVPTDAPVRTSRRSRHADPERAVR